MNPEGSRRIEPAKYVPRSGGRTTRSVSINPRVCLVLLLLGIGAFCAWFMLTAKAVYVEVEPPVADVDIAGGLKLKLADRYLIRPGEYGLNLSAEGYFPIEDRLAVADDRAQHYVYSLRKRPGHLNFDTGPVTGAEVIMDGASRGKTPVTVRDLPPGEYLVEINADRYFPFRDTINVEGLDREQSIEVDLEPAWADVSFDSSPAGAQVFTGDENLGETPLTTELLQGEHTIRIKAAGYKAWRDTIKVVAGEPLAVTGITLEPADATLFLVSRPARANATVNGNYLGLTPLEVALTPGDTAEIRLFKQGYKAAAESVSARSGEQKRLTVTLQPELVTVVVNARPEDAQLFVDGAPAGTANRTIQLSTSKHKIEIRKEGYVGYQTTLTPHAGVEHELNVTLKTIRQVKLENTRPVITSPAGQNLKLFRAGEFTMGASRREPGRRANETIRKVKLTRSFYLGLKEVTNAEYRMFDTGHSSGLVKGNSLNGDTQPVVSVTWEQAARYCNWLSEQAALEPFYLEKDGRITGFDKTSEGFRLPTEAEWAWAARVLDGGAMLKYPWGAELPPGAKSGNFADRKSAALFGRIIENYDDGFAVTAPAGSFAPNHKGVFDLGGNVAEWVSDFYDVVVGAGNKAEVDPVGPEQGEFHVIRGSSWAHATITQLRLSYRDYGNKPRQDVGFRVARYAE